MLIFLPIAWLKAQPSFSSSSSSTACQNPNCRYCTDEAHQKAHLESIQKNWFLTGDSIQDLGILHQALCDLKEFLDNIDLFLPISFWNQLLTADQHALTPYLNEGLRSFYEAIFPMHELILQWHTHYHGPDQPMLKQMDPLTHLLNRLSQAPEGHAIDALQSAFEEGLMPLWGQESFKQHSIINCVNYYKDWLINCYALIEELKVNVYQHNCSIESIKTYFSLLEQDLLINFYQLRINRFSGFIRGPYNKKILRLHRETQQITFRTTSSPDRMNELQELKHKHHQSKAQLLNAIEKDYQKLAQESRSIFDPYAGGSFGTQPLDHVFGHPLFYKSILKQNLLQLVHDLQKEIQAQLEAILKAKKSSLCASSTACEQLNCNHCAHHWHEQETLITAIQNLHQGKDDLAIFESHILPSLKTFFKQLETFIPDDFWDQMEHAHQQQIKNFLSHSLITVRFALAPLYQYLKTHARAYDEMNRLCPRFKINRLIELLGILDIDSEMNLIDRLTYHLEVIRPWPSKDFVPTAIAGQIAHHLSMINECKKLIEKLNAERNAPLLCARQALKTQFALMSQILLIKGYQMTIHQYMQEQLEGDQLAIHCRIIEHTIERSYRELAENEIPLGHPLLEGLLQTQQQIVQNPLLAWSFWRQAMIDMIDQALASIEELMNIQENLKNRLFFYVLTSS